MTNEELVRLADALQKFEDFLAPDPSCLAPLGEEPLSKGIMKFFNPEFASVLQRSASAYSGFHLLWRWALPTGGYPAIRTQGVQVCQPYSASL